MMVWEEKQAGKKPSWVTVRAELVARLVLLKDTRWKNYTLHNSAVLLDEMLFSV